jgi:hypothetical protein
MAMRSTHPPEHGPAEGPLVCAVLEQHNLKQGGQDLRQQLWPLSQMLADGLRQAVAAKNTVRQLAAGPGEGYGWCRAVHDVHVKMRRYRVAAGGARIA